MTLISLSLAMNWMLNGPVMFEGRGDLAARRLDLAHRLDIGLLRREDHGRVAGVDAGVLDVLDDGRSDDLAVLGHGVDLDLLGVEDELADDDRVFGRDARGLLEVCLQVALVEDDAHGRAAQDVGGPDEDRDSRPSRAKASASATLRSSRQAGWSMPSASRSLENL